MVLKTATKSIASMLKNQAGRHPRFRQFIIDIGQGYYRFTTTDVEIRPLNEEKAIQAASGLFAELVFSVVVVALVCEIRRRTKSKAAKKEEMFEQKFKEMYEKRERVEQRMDGLLQKLNEIDQLARDKGLPGIFALILANYQTHESCKSTS